MNQTISTARQSRPHRTNSGPITARLLITLGLLTGLAAFSIDLYLPAFPSMTSDLSTSATGVQLSLTAFLVGSGCGQLAFGPWSDRTGRLIPLYAGLVLFVVGGGIAATAPNVLVLVFARLVQGIGGSAGMVLGRAIILDLASGVAAARAMSRLMLISGVAPIIAPIVGGLLTDTIGWRGLLGALAAFGLLTMTLTVLSVRESLPPQRRRELRSSVRPTIASALLSRRYLGYTVAFSFSMAVMLAYISASPFVYQNMIGFSTTAYGLAFAVNAAGLMVCTLLAARLVKKVTPQALTCVGLALSLIASAVILILTLSAQRPEVLIVPMFCAIAPLGLVFGNTTTLALSSVPESVTGVASAVLGALQFTLAGVVAALVGIAGEDTAIPLALTMLGAGAIALTGTFLANTCSTSSTRNRRHSK